MRLKTWLAGGAAAALVLAGVAVADQAPLSATSSSASLAATSTSDVKTSTCTSTNGTFQSTHATYSGTNSVALSALSGPIQIKTDSLVNTGNGLGLLKGHFTVNGPGKGESKGKLSAVVNGTTVVGWIEGHAPGGVKFAGTFTGSWSANTGFSSLQIGTSSSSNELVLLSGHCGAPKAGKGPKTNTPKTHTPKTPPPPHGKKKGKH